MSCKWFGTGEASRDSLWSKWSPTIWVKAADEMFSKITELQCPWLKVLIADERAMTPSAIRPMSSGDTLFQDWKPLAHRIWQAGSPNETWLEIGLYYQYNNGAMGTSLDG